MTYNLSKHISAMGFAGMLAMIGCSGQGSSRESLERHVAAHHAPPQIEDPVPAPQSADAVIGRVHSSTSLASCLYGEDVATITDPTKGEITIYSAPGTADQNESKIIVPNFFPTSIYTNQQGLYVSGQKNDSYTFTIIALDANKHREVYSQDLDPNDSGYLAHYEVIRTITAESMGEYLVGEKSNSLADTNSVRESLESMLQDGFDCLPDALNTLVNEHIEQKLPEGFHPPYESIESKGIQGNTGSHDWYSKDQCIAINKNGLYLQNIGSGHKHFNVGAIVLRAGPEGLKYYFVWDQMFPVSEQVYGAAKSDRTSDSACPTAWGGGEAPGVGGI